MSPIQPHHIIAIGASAGGMEEILTFFDNTPLDGAAYVIVQHLSPDFKSRMVDLVSRHSILAVKEAVHGLRVQRNEIYLIPSKQFMTIQDERLYLSDKEAISAPHLTINTFFKSLAENCGEKAIGIIFSGLGSDGTEGVKALKKAGGLIIARNPQTSEFSSMPTNAIASGVVDFVLEPEAMPAIIDDYVKHGGELISYGKEDDKNLQAIIDLINDQLPLDFSDYKQTTILRRVKRRAAHHDFVRLKDYLDFLKKSPEEVKTLAQDFLISVTAFFRDKEAYETIEKTVIPGILEKLQPDEEFKIWIAGCATGEEAYSMAILICEQLTEKHKDTIVKIFATDLDRIALNHAGKGVYSEDISKDVSAERLEKFFIKEDNTFRVSPGLRKMVIFSQHDLVKNPPYCNMQLISCRNLLIYMAPQLQKKIFFMLLFGLKKDGYLFLGASENPLPIMQHLEITDKRWKIFKVLETKRHVRFDAFSLPELVDIKAPVYPHREVSAPNLHNSLAEAMNGELVEELGYLALCITETNQVIKSYGDTSKYLLQKNFTLNLADLLPRPLAVAFNALSIKALQINDKVSVEAISVDENTIVNLSVAPLKLKSGDQNYLLVTFSSGNNNAVSKKNIVFDAQLYLDQYTLNLEHELKTVKDKLQATYENLDASNENLQSFNEELLSANEEMQSTNEEMQSVNEELHTINADYQSKNKELQELNDDLNNYFRSNINGQLFVNNDLVLMKFSPGTVRQINLVPSDIGRPLHNITTNIKFETIINDLKQVVTDGKVITKELEANDGRWYNVMTMPYIQTDGKRTGAIITFNDITDLKATQLELNTQNEALLRINADLDNFVHTTSHDLLAPLANIEMSIQVMNTIGIADSRLQRFFDTINSSVKKFRALIKEIADIAKVESGMITMEMIDLNKLLNDIEWSLESKIKSARATIIREFQVDQVYFSKKNLRSILYNLVANSIKFKSELPPVINVHSNKKNGHFILSVEDNGIGMAKDDLHKIFNMYGRISHNVEGSGIGLYLAKKIIDASGGKIELESEPGKGSKFTIHFTNEEEKNLVGVIGLN